MGRFVLFAMLTSFLAASGCAMEEEASEPEMVSNNEPPLELDNMVVSMATPRILEPPPAELRSTVVSAAPRICLPREPDTGYREIQLGLYFMPDLDLPVDAILEGCNLWNVVGISCIRVEDPGEANLTIREVTSGDHHGHAAAFTEVDGTPTAFSITFYPLWDYLADHPDPTPREIELLARRHTGHEIGHALGLGRHIPSLLDDTAPVVHPVHGELKGPALMNGGGWSIEQEPMSMLDVWYFDLRNEELSDRRLGIEPESPCAPLE